MAEFEAKVYRLKIEEHANADALEIARVGDYRSIVRKGQFKTGDLGVYIPEQAICPLWLIKRLGLEGRLAGKAKNRVKAVKLRGVLSQGLIYPVIPESDEFDPHIIVETTKVGAREFPDGTEIRYGAWEGADLTEILGITKYEPIVPASMSGEVIGCAHTIKFDIENIKKYPDVLQDGEEVVITEKLHGTWCCFGYHPEVEGPIVTSKGLSGRGLIFKLTDKNKDSNHYVRMLESTRDENGETLIDRAAKWVTLNYQSRRTASQPDEPVYILGEIFGRGIQDLHYGKEKPAFEIFDVYVGEPGQGHYLNEEDRFSLIMNVDGAVSVPRIYVGPYSKEVVDQYTDGGNIVGDFNIREGVVVKPTVERRNDDIGRVVLKSVSEDYLLRGGNATEFN